MRRTSVAVVVMFAVVALCVGSALSYRSGDDGGSGAIAIYVAPGTIAKSAPCTCVTIHTDVPYGAVEEVSAAVNGTDVDVAKTFEDNRGNLVLKLNFADVVALVEQPSAKIALTVTVTVDSLVGVEVRVAVATVRVKK